MVTKTLDAHIETSPDIAGGKPRIAGRRITVQHIVVWHERMGKSVDEISAEYDLDNAEIHAALAFYFDHREEIDKSMRESEDFVASLRASTPSKLRHKLPVIVHGLMLIYEIMEPIEMMNHIEFL